MGGVLVEGADVVLYVRDVALVSDVEGLLAADGELVVVVTVIVDGVV